MMDCTLRIFPFYSFVIVMDFIRGNNSYHLIDKFNGKVIYNKNLCMFFTFSDCKWFTFVLSIAAFPVDLD